MMSGDATTAMKPIIKVIWRDAADMDGTWSHEEEVNTFSESDQEIISVGFLVSKTEKYLTLAADWDAECQNYSRVTKIPAAWVVSTLVLDPPPIKTTT